MTPDCFNNSASPACCKPWTCAARSDANRLGHAEFLELICQDEINVRQQRLMERRTKAADFRGLKTLEDFDWSFNPAIHRKDIYDLATGNFIRQAKDVLFLGPPGVGKTHLAQAVGYEAIKMNFQVLYRSIFDLVRDFMKDEAFSQQDRTLRRYLNPELLIIDDFGLKQLPKNSGEHLFEVIMRRYENRSTIMTSNRPLEEWGKLLGDVPTAGAILDRFLHHAKFARGAHGFGAPACDLCADGLPGRFGQLDIKRLSHAQAGAPARRPDAAAAGPGGQTWTATGRADGPGQSGSRRGQLQLADYGQPARSRAGDRAGHGVHSHVQRPDGRGVLCH
jgi:DNA replication protein DnaC